MAYVYTAIVGMRFRNLPAKFRSAIDISKTKLSREPTNSHDKFAVKCIFNGVHFGYIARTDSEEVFNYLSTFSEYRIKQLESGENFYKISITFQKLEIPTNKAKPSVHRASKKPVKESSSSSIWLFLLILALLYFLLI